MLGQAGRLAGALYLFGYCVELVLKAAYCRMIGVGPSDPIWAKLSAAGLQSASVKHHRIVDLHSLVAGERRNRGFGVDPVFEGELQLMSLLSASHWKEELRYSSVSPTRGEAEEMDEATTWLMIHRDRLWR